MTLLLSIALGASAEKTHALIQAGKPEKAARRATRQLDQEIETVRERDAWEEVLADATVAILRAEPDLALAQWFLMEFPYHLDVAEISELEGELALEQARQFGTEAVYLGLSREYYGLESGRQARREAEDLHFESLERSPDGLRRFLLRYPRGEYAEEVREQELASALAWAEVQGTADAWLQVLEGYPDHPDQEAIRETYRQIAFAEIEGAGPEQLWRFAGDFPETKEGREAAQKGLEAGTLNIQRPGQAVGSAKTVVGSVDYVVDELVLTFPATPPSGFELRVEVEVDGQPWAETAASWAPALGLAGLETGGAELSRSGNEVTWRPDVPICSPNGEAIVVLVRTMLVQGEEVRASRDMDFLTTARCQGARRMVFTRLEDDLEGPVAVLHFDPAAGGWVVEPTAWRIPDEWECSHASAVDGQGVTVVCGTRTVKAAWDGRTLWARMTPEDLRRTERVAVDVLDESVPLMVSGRGAKQTLKDPAGKVLEVVGEREVILTLPSEERAFGELARTGGAPSIPTDLEKPMASGPPLPEGAVASSSCPAITNLGAASLGGGPGAGAVGIEPEDPEQWGQVVLLPAPADGWTCFEWQGHSYARTVVVSSSGPTILTLRSDGEERWAIDQSALP